MAGQVNGYSSKAIALFIMPVISIFLLLLFRFLPLTDPYRKNFSQFENYFNHFVIIISAFLFYLYLLTIAWHLGFQFNMVRFLSPAFAGLFYFTGVLVSVAKRNWFVGIRTPWTMSSDKVWNKTHQLGGKLFKLAALTTMIGTLFPDYSFYLLFIPLVATSIFIYIYSYVVYRRLG